MRRIFNYLCNAMMNFVRLDRYGTHFDRVLIHPRDWAEPGDSREQIALSRIRSQYPHVQLRPVEVLSTSAAQVVAAALAGAVGGGPAGVRRWRGGCRAARSAAMCGSVHVDGIL
ncbi:hypothetical protein VTG60DRAFT_6190 [Thermothelomyces hinnuleus]